MSPIPNILGSLSESLASSNAPSAQTTAAPSRAPMSTRHMLFVVAMLLGACVLAAAVGYHLAPFMKGISRMLYGPADDEEKQSRTRNTRSPSPLPEVAITPPPPTYSQRDAYRSARTYAHNQASPPSICPGPPPLSTIYPGPPPLPTIFPAPLPRAPLPSIYPVPTPCALTSSIYPVPTPRALTPSICPGPPPRAPLPPLPRPMLNNAGPNTFDSEGEFTPLMPPPPRTTAQGLPRMPDTHQDRVAALRAILGTVNTNSSALPAVAPHPQGRERKRDLPACLRPGIPAKDQRKENRMWLMDKENAGIPSA